jgi:hypothetical protein
MRECQPECYNFTVFFARGDDRNAPDTRSSSKHSPQRGYTWQLLAASQDACKQGPLGGGRHVGVYGLARPVQLPGLVNQGPNQAQKSLIRGFLHAGIAAQDRGRRGYVINPFRRNSRAACCCWATVYAGQFSGRSYAAAAGVTKLATSCATASPYICLTVCCAAIQLLRDDCVAQLVGSLASSARCTLSRNRLCSLRRLMIAELSSFTHRIPHCTQKLAGKFARKSVGIASNLKTEKSLLGRARCPARHRSQSQGVCLTLQLSAYATQRFSSLESVSGGSHGKGTRARSRDG